MRNRVNRRVPMMLAVVLAAGLVSAGAPAVASAETGPSVPLPPVESTPVTKEPPKQRPSDPAASSELQGNQGPRGGDDGGGTATATPLSPSSGWQVSPHTGDFTWSYPMRVPPAPGGLEPNLALSYRSSVVDGRTSVTNNQPSWIGDGWDLSPGFVERTYGACAEDTDGTTLRTGDLCWRSDNATASYGGGGGMLICCDADGKWRARDDDGARIERLPGADNDDDNGEHWKITTVDGTQYWFGSQRTSKSTWTVPVFGDDDGEPCNDTKHCVQAWRWNLDKVVDRNGNVIRYFYETETNSYGMEGKEAAVSYVRGGTLARIEYGLHETEATTPAARVVFGTADRCVRDSTCAPEQPDNWPDVPWKDKCDTATCADRHSPTFWSTKRLHTITTQVRDGASYTDVDRWTLDQQFPDAGSGEDAALWLKGIRHDGLVGGTAAVPSVRFEGTAYPNRVVAVDGVSPLNRYRITGVVTESGGWTSVNYGSECRHDALPASPEANQKRCFPVRWRPKNAAERTDYFHKYVVTSIVQSDRLSSSTQHVTRYEYLDGAAWHWDTSEFTKEDRKTWNEFRGFSRVRIRTGADRDPSGSVTMSELRFHRGMDGDRSRGPVTVSDSEGRVRPDSDWLRGFRFESATFEKEAPSDGPDPQRVTKAITDPGWQGPTASRGAHHAYIVRPETRRTFTALESGGVRITKSKTTYDDRGLPTKVDDLGDEATAADDRCTTTEYARNAADWLLNLPAHNETVAVHCGQTAVFPRDAIADTRNTFDDNGNVRVVQEAEERPATGPVYVTTSTTTYDAHGRATSVTDAVDGTTTTAYTPRTGGPVTQTVTTSPPTTAVPQGLVTTTKLAPAWGTPTLVTDPNGRKTEIVHDPLGRTAKVWLPNRPSASNPKASAEFTYLFPDDALPAVTANRIGPNGTQITTTTLYDGWLRTRQTQAPAFGGGRLLTDTRYDSQGRVWKSTQPYFNNAAVDTTLWVAADTDVPGHTRTQYDGAGRPEASVYFTGAHEKWRTTTKYGGDRVHVTPPVGGTATTTVTDARGQTVELRRYTTPAPSDSYDSTRYAYTPAGLLDSVTDPANSTWRYTYDLRGRKITAADPDSGTTTMTYDNAGRLTTSRDARGVTLAHSYDALGRKTGTFADRVGGPKLAEWAYDTVSFGKGHAASSTRWVGTTPYVVEVLGYDEMYQPTGTSVVIPAAEGLLAGAYETYYTYEPDGSLSGVDYPAAGELPEETVNYDYHDIGLLKSGTGGYDGKTVRHVLDTEYTRYGEMSRLHLGEGTKRAWLSQYYDADTRRLDRTIVDAEVPSPMQSDTHYTYDPAGNITSIADTPQAQPAAVDVQCFTHDHLRRLTNAWTPAIGTWSETAGCQNAPAVAGLTGPAPYWHSYTFDEGGNRDIETRHAAAGDTVRDYTYDVPGHAHALGSVSTTGPGGGTVDSYAYNPAGHTSTRTAAGTTQQLDWDKEGRLAKVTASGKETSFVYAPDGTRLIRRDPTAVTLYLGNQELRLNRTGGNPTVTRYYTHGDRTVAMRKGTGALTWLASDHQATDQIAINSGTLAVTRRRQLPHGAPRGATTAWPGERGFVGGTLDGSTGLTHIGAREYDPTTGRFISVDPILDLADPGQMNGYAYANHSPVTSSDPTGLIPKSCPDGECRGGHFDPGEGPASTYNPPVNHGPANPSGISGTGCGARACPGKGVDPNAVYNGCGARPCKTGSVDPNNIDFEPVKVAIPQPPAVKPFCEGFFNCTWEAAWRGAMATNPVTLVGQTVADFTGTNITPDYVSFDFSTFLPGMPKFPLGPGGAVGFSLSKHGQLTFNEPYLGVGTPNEAKLRRLISTSARLGWLTNRDAGREEVNGFLQGDATSFAGAVPIPGPASLSFGTVTTPSGQRSFEYGVVVPRSPALAVTRSYGHVLIPG